MKIKWNRYDNLVIKLALIGKSTMAIKRATGLTEGQINYRKRLKRVKTKNYRDSVPTSYQVEQLIKACERDIARVDKLLRR